MVSRARLSSVSLGAMHTLGIDDTHELGPEACILIAIACVLVGLWLSIAAFSPTLRAKLDWGDPSGPAMSQLGARAAALSAYLFALTLFAHAFQWSAEGAIGILTLCAVVLVVSICLLDYDRSKDT